MCVICEHQAHQHSESGCRLTTCSCIKFEEKKSTKQEAKQGQKSSTQHIREQTEKWGLNLERFKKNTSPAIKLESNKDIQTSHSEIWDEVEANWSKIDRLVEDNEYEKVNKEIEIILGKKFENISAWIKKGHNYSSWGKYDDAIFCYNNALIIDKKENKKSDRRDWEILNFMGIVHGYNDDNEVARDFFKNVLKIKEDYVPALQELGLSYRQSGEYELAIEQFKKLLSIEKNNIDGLDHLGYAYELNKNIEKAIECYNQSKLAENKDEKDNYADIRLAHCYFLKNDLEHAELLINKERITKNETSASYSIRGKILRDKKEYDDAILNIEKSITKSPESRSEWYQLAWCNGEKGNHELALEYYKKNLQINDNFDESGSYAIGFELEMLDRKKEARDWYKQELSKYPKNTKILTALAFLSKEFGDHDESIKIWDKISEITPDDQWIPFRKSAVLIVQNKLEESLECIEKILTADKQKDSPSKASLMNQKGWILYKMKKYEESMEWIEKSLAIEPKLANTIDSKAEVLFAQKKYDEAEKAFQELFEIEKSHSAELGIADCKRRRGNQIKNDDELKQKYYHEAIKIYDSILKKNKTDDYAWYSKGLCYWNLEKYEDSRNCQLEAVKIEPKNITYWNELGDIAKITNKHDQAMVCFDKSIEISPNNHAFVEKGNILYDQKKQYEKAVSQYDQALKIEVTTDTLIMKADALYMSARKKTENYSLDDALDCYVEVLKRDPENPDALGGKGNTLREMKKHDDAITSLNQSIKIVPEDYWTYKIKFLTYEEMKNYQDAINMENTMLEKFPDEEEHILNLMMNLYKNSGNEIKVKEYEEKIQKLEDLK